MPYITCLNSFQKTVKSTFPTVKSDVSASELASAFVDYEVKVRSFFDNEICFGSRIEESSSSDDSYLLIGCEPKSDFLQGFLSGLVGAEPYALQIFDSKQKQIFYTSLNDKGNLGPQNLTPEFVKLF